MGRASLSDGILNRMLRWSTRFSVLGAVYTETRKYRGTQTNFNPSETSPRIEVAVTA